MKNPSLRIQNIAPSLTVAVDSLAKKLKAEGKDIISLGAGEPDWDTPEEICSKAKAAIDERKTRYSAPQGILSVRKAVAQKLREQNGIEYAPEQIVLTSGAKHAVFNSLLAIVNPGDEVIIPEPYWVTYPELVKLLGGTPVIIHTQEEDDFQMTARTFQEAITPRTKALILNNPTNPTGTLYAEKNLAKIAEVIVQNDLYAVSDEIYEHFSYSDNFQFKSLAAFPGMAERTLVINGLSKSHCMTGWRIGYVAAPPQIAALIAKAQGQTTHHPSNIAQYAAEEALQMPLHFVQRMRDEFKRRRDFLYGKISQIPGVRVRIPQGAFYLFANISGLLGKTTLDGKTLTNSVEFCTYLLESVGLAIVPGSAFGRDGYVRFSYAASQQELSSAADRFEKGVRALR
ncbi:MAG: pyridoxal phosphate-dependent aminotransferase [Fibrobacter intestinalis]|uniref:pyridoxal phosphate-dependent aminotransferase n=1 Tax=Fibrobacter intestinalis TaxID=28122 RepID=UPI003F09BC56